MSRNGETDFSELLIRSASIAGTLSVLQFAIGGMPENPIETEEEEIAADAAFVRGSSTAAKSSKETSPSVSTAESTQSAESARAAVLFRLVEGPMAPQEASEGTTVSTGHAHRTLNELEKRDLVELLVPEDASDGPIFGLTVQGEKVTFHIERQQQA